MAPDEVLTSAEQESYPIRAALDAMGTMNRSPLVLGGGGSDIARTALEPRLPPGKGQWEYLKPIIRDLYVVRGLPLPQVMETMEAQHKFKASKRMYKARFKAWNWSTYKKTSTTTTLRSRVRAGQSTAMTTAPYDDQLSSQASRLAMHDGRYTLHLDTALRAYRDFIEAWAETDPRWRVPPFGNVDSSFNQRDWIGVNSSVYTSRRFFKRGDSVRGGRYLRLAFQGVDDLIWDDHLAIVKELLVMVPGVLVKFPSFMADNVISLYVNYLYQQASIKRPNHPIVAMARSLQMAYTTGGAKQVLQYSYSLASILRDTVLRLRGVDGTSLMIMALCIDYNDRDWLFKTMRGCDDMALLAAHEHSEDSIHVLRYQSMKLNWAAKMKVFEADFLPTAERIAALSKKWYETREGIPNDADLETRVERLFRGAQLRLAGHWRRNGDRDKLLHYCNQTILLRDRDGGRKPSLPWVTHATKVEKLLMEAGMVQEAEELGRRCYELQFPVEVRRAVEREEDAVDVLGMGSRGDSNSS